MAALLAALRLPAPDSLRRYLWCHLATIPFVWGGGLLFGDWSITYAAIYCACSGLILVSIGSIAWECLNGRHFRARTAAIALILALCLGKLASSETSGLGWISLVEGVILFWAGMIVGFTAPYIQRWDIALTLSLFWMAQALYSFGWTLHGHLWDRWNWTVPPLTGIAAFSIIAWRLRAQMRQLRRRYS